MRGQTLGCKCRTCVSRPVSLAATHAGGQVTAECCQLFASAREGSEHQSAAGQASETLRQRQDSPRSRPTSPSCLQKLGKHQESQVSCRDLSKRVLRCIQPDRGHKELIFQHKIPSCLKRNSCKCLSAPPLLARCCLDYPRLTPNPGIFSLRMYLVF